MTAAFKIVIPARYGSTRFPGKPLADIGGKPMIQRVYERARSSGADEVIVATDDIRIEQAVRNFGARVCMTSPEHPSGSDRLAEVVQQCGWDDAQIIVNVQGDEPLMPPELITQVARNLATHVHCSIATLCTPIELERDKHDPNSVKVIFDQNQQAIYFSRSTIPYQFPDTAGTASATRLYRHIGIYAYRALYLKQYRERGVSPLEQAERLEQLRALWHGEKIHVDIATTLPGVSVDTPADLRKVQHLLHQG